MGSADIKDDDSMTVFCPEDTFSRDISELETADISECSCKPTRGVEQDIASGTSPLGTNHHGCVKVASELIFEQPLNGISFILQSHRL